MRTRLLPIAGRLLVPLVLAGCQESSTAPPGGATAGQSAGSAPSMSPAISGAAAGAINTHFVVNGPYGNSYYFGEPDAAGNTLFAMVLVFQLTAGGTPSHPPAHLIYDVRRCDASFNLEFCTPLEAGVGPIPAGDLEGNGVRGLKLNTNTATNPDFNRFIGAGGLISVERVKAPGAEVRFMGIGQSKLPGVFNSHTKGTVTHVPATVTGTVVGFAIATSAADFGTNHNVEVTHTFIR